MRYPPCHCPACIVASVAVHRASLSLPLPRPALCLAQARPSDRQNWGAGEEGGRGFQSSLQSTQRGHTRLANSLPTIRSPSTIWVSCSWYSCASCTNACADSLPWLLVQTFFVQVSPVSSACQARRRCVHGAAAAAATVTVTATAGQACGRAAQYGAAATGVDGAVHQVLQAEPVLAGGCAALPAAEEHGQALPGWKQLQANTHGTASMLATRRP